MIEGVMTIVIYALIVSIMLGLFMFALADVAVPEPFLRRVLTGALVLVGGFGVILMLDLIGVLDLGFPRVRL